MNHPYPDVGTDRPTSIPPARGELSARLVAHLLGTAQDLPQGSSADDPLSDEDLHLALYLCYELHYRGLVDVAPSMEWDSEVLRFRRCLEHSFEGSLRAAIPHEEIEPASVPDALRGLVSGTPSALASHLARSASFGQFREFLIHRSAYQLKEADPHSWIIPRLSGKPKAALLEIQFDEYGSGDAARMHSALFADAMRALDLDPSYGHYLPVIPGTTLATVNLMSLFGLNRRLLGAAVGHIAGFELGSSIPNASYARGLRRIRIADEGLRFFDEHVVADSVHDMIATYDLAASLAQAEPDIATDIVFGAKALDLLESRFSDTLLDSWSTGSSSLLGVNEVDPLLLIS